MMREQIKGKTVVCILSGSNNDISRLPEVRVRSLIYENKQAYYILTSSSSRTLPPMQSTSGFFLKSSSTQRTRTSSSSTLPRSSTLPQDSA
jgi:hypothetical protein